MSSENKPHLVSVVSELLASAKTENQTGQNHAGGGEFLRKQYIFDSLWFFWALPICQKIKYSWQQKAYATTRIEIFFIIANNNRNCNHVIR